MAHGSVESAIGALKRKLAEDNASLNSAKRMSASRPTSLELKDSIRGLENKIAHREVLPGKLERGEVK